jgi:hypothetical protein
MSGRERAEQRGTGARQRRSPRTGEPGPVVVVVANTARDSDGIAFRQHLRSVGGAIEE